MLLNTNSGKNKSKFKLILTQKLQNDKELISSSVFLYLDQNAYANADEYVPLTRLPCKTFSKTELHSNQHSKLFCFNMTLDLNEEFKTFYPSHNLKNKINLMSDFQFRVYASVASSDFLLIPSGVQTNKNLLKQNYLLLNIVENLSVKNLILDDMTLPMHYCNLLEIESLRLEFSFKSNINADHTNNYQMYDSNNVEIFTIDVDISRVCARKKASLLENLQYFSNQPVLAEATNTKQIDDNNSTQSMKVHVVLPIILSFFFVTFFILIAVFFRR